jgi:hypothetical protein
MSPFQFIDTPVSAAIDTPVSRCVIFWVTV